MKKKKPHRSKIKYPSLNPSYSPKVRQEYIDIDYIDKLSDEPTIKMPDGSIISEKAWMDKFMGEFVGADLDFKNLKNNLHNTPELKKDCTDRNNARNRCMYGIAKANGLVWDDIRSEDERLIENHTEYENELIEYLDNLNEFQNSIDSSSDD